MILETSLQRFGHSRFAVELDNTVIDSFVRVDVSGRTRTNYFRRKRFQFNYFVLSVKYKNCLLSVLEHQHSPVCQEFLKLGAPRSLRGRLWSQILGSNVKPSVNEIV